jgi:hypothetical protein
MSYFTQCIFISFWAVAAAIKKRHQSPMDTPAYGDSRETTTPVNVANGPSPPTTS